MPVSLPTISVVVPLYNHEKYIRAAMESLLEQELAPHEIVVVNDGSTDGSERIMAEILHLHPQIVFWSQANQGAHQAINAGIQRSTGELVAILNSDDAYHPKRLMRCAQVMADSPKISAVTTALDFMDARGRKAKNRWYEKNRSFYDKEGDLALSLMNGNFFMTTSNIVVRRHVFQEIGYFARLRYVHDLDFFLRLLVHGKTIHLIDDPLLSYRMHAKNTILEEHAHVRSEWAFACARFIVAARGRSEWRKKGWGYVERFNRIMERHSLTRLLNLFLIYFASRPDSEKDDDGFDKDSDFMKLIRQTAR